MTVGVIVDTWRQYSPCYWKSKMVKCVSRWAKGGDTASVWQWTYSSTGSVMYELVFGAGGPSTDDTIPLYNSQSSAERVLQNAGYSREA